MYRGGKERAPRSAGCRPEIQVGVGGASTLSIVHGRLSLGRGHIDAPVGRDPHHTTRMAVVTSGRRAVTTYRVREVFVRPRSSMCAWRPDARTRSAWHCASIGHPVVGDPVYGRRVPAHGLAPPGAARPSSVLRSSDQRRRDDVRVPLPDDLRASVQSLRAAGERSETRYGRDQARGAGRGEGARHGREALRRAIVRWRTKFSNGTHLPPARPVGIGGEAERGGTLGIRDRADRGRAAVVVGVLDIACTATTRSNGRVTRGPATTILFDTDPSRRARRMTCCSRAVPSGRDGCRESSTGAGHDSTRGARRPRSPRAADSSRIHRQETFLPGAANGRGAMDRERRPATRVVIEERTRSLPERTLVRCNVLPGSAAPRPPHVPACGHVDGHLRGLAARAVECRDRGQRPRSCSPAERRATRSG